MSDWAHYLNDYQLYSITHYASISLMNPTPTRNAQRPSNKYTSSHPTSPLYLSHATAGKANLLLVFLVKTFVIACLIVTPAFSISFFDNPVVMQTLRAGCSFQSSSLPLLLGATGILLRRVIRTPFASDCDLFSSASSIGGKKAYLINTFLQNSLLLLNTHASRVDHVWLKNK
jgi:hypothetical protein